MAENLRKIFLSSIYEDFDILHSKRVLYIYPSPQLVCKYIKSEENIIFFDMDEKIWNLKYDKISGLLELDGRKNITIQNQIFGILAKNFLVGVNGNFIDEEYVYKQLENLGYL